MRTREAQIDALAYDLSFGNIKEKTHYKRLLEKEFSEAEKRIRDQIENKKMNALYHATRNTFRNWGGPNAQSIFDREYAAAKEVIE